MKSFGGYSGTFLHCHIFSPRPPKKSNLLKTNSNLHKHYGLVGLELQRSYWVSESAAGSRWWLCLNAMLCKLLFKYCVCKLNLFGKVRITKSTIQSKDFLELEIFHHEQLAYNTS